jgi:hypothetical protein
MSKLRGQSEACPPSLEHRLKEYGGHGAKSAFAHHTAAKGVSVIASEAKQSIEQQARKLDCFVASAPRNDG